MPLFLEAKVYLVLRYNIPHYSGYTFKTND